jgi:hypothetical protein
MARPEAEIVVKIANTMRKKIGRYLDEQIDLGEVGRKDREKT